jgi:hypothetical protein
VLRGPPLQWLRQPMALDLLVRRHLWLLSQYEIGRVAVRVAGQAAHSHLQRSKGDTGPDANRPPIRALLEVRDGVKLLQCVAVLSEQTLDLPFDGGVALHVTHDLPHRVGPVVEFASPLSPLV